MRISVLGIGYFGAVSCGCLAASGHEVVGADIAADKVAMLAERLLAPNSAAFDGPGLVVPRHIGDADRPALLAALRGHRVLDLAGVPEVRDHPGISDQGLCW